MHRNKVFRAFMQFGYLPVTLIAVAVLFYVGARAYLLAPKEEGQLLLWFIVYAPIVLLLTALCGHLVIWRHYRRLDEMRAYLDAAGGQVFVDSVLREESSRLLDRDADPQVIEASRSRMRRLADWARRLGYQAKTNPYAYLETYEKAT